MKTLKILAYAAFTLGVVAAASANPPTQVGDSFFITSMVGPFGISNNNLLYLAPDGTCKQLYFKATFDENVSYLPSQSGTYTYIQTQDNPYEATLTSYFSGGPTYYVLEFAGDSSGLATVNSFIGQSRFALLLASKNSFLTNVSNRVTLRPTDTAITGFVIEGAAPQFVLIRTVGPTLAQFGVSPVSGNPRLNLFSGIGTDQIASGQPWGSVTGYDAQAMSWIFTIAGAFQLQTGSNDVVYIGLLPPGTYTAQAFDATTGATGASALTEVYILPYSS